MNANTSDEHARAKKLLSQLSEYTAERNVSKHELAKQLGIPYKTLSKWWSFTLGREARMPSEVHLSRIGQFLSSRENPEMYTLAEEARHRAEKIRYLLLLLEDEIGWFRDQDKVARDEFRRELDASDVGYISSLLTMLTEEEKFNRWRALTTTSFNSFKRR